MIQQEFIHYQINNQTKTKQFIKMKFSYSAITLLLVSSAIAAPIGNNTMENVNAEASIAITNSTVTPSVPLTISTTQPAAATMTLADAMSGTTATASISILGQNVTAQSSGASSLVGGASAIALPIAVISALCLM